MSSKMFDKINRYYKNGLWNKTRVANMVLKNVITAEEFEEITGQEYTNDQN
ncbi:MAG: XkdX family protein [Lachnospiraceae bacterium]|nr:XkdX family protein [Lachnospiraceae bacterium]